MRKDCTKTVGWKQASVKQKNTWKNKKAEFERNYYRNPKLCVGCTLALPYDKRRNDFCSHSCSATLNNKGVRRHGEAWKLRTAVCSWCNTEFSWKSNRGDRRKYCGWDCFGAAQSEKTKIEWLSGKTTTGMRRPTLRRYLIEERGNKCEIEGCSVGSEWLGKPIVLTVDHIDGNAADDRPQNVRLICANCHSQTDTFTSRNKGNGRGARGLSLG